MSERLKKTPVCPFCQKDLYKKVAHYPVQKMAKHFRCWLREFKQSLQTEFTDICRTVGCTNKVCKHCKSCKEFLCEACEMKTCSMGAERHDVIGVKESQQALQSWILAREKNIRAFESEHKEVVKKIREASLRLHNSLESTLSQEIATTISVLTEAETEFNGLDNKLHAEQSNLRFAKELSSFDEIGSIYIARQLQEYDEYRKVVFGAQEMVMKGTQCYDAVWSANSHLVVSKDGGVEVIDVSGMQTKGPTVVKSIILDGSAFSLAVHESNIIIGFKPTTSSMHHTVFITLNSDYDEIGRWSKELSGCDFTVADGKIILSSSLFSSCLKRFSLEGEPFPDIFFNGGTAGVAAMSSATVALADNKYNKVYRKQVHEHRSNILWSVDLASPFALCVDVNENLWITSSDQDVIFIVSSHGKKLQELTVPGHSALTSKTGIMVHDDYFYVCHEHGVDRFAFSLSEDNLEKL
ncbi:uncharacterized protein [Watersipora subatra]